MLTRRTFLKAGATGAGAVYLATRARFIERAYGAFAGPQTQLPGDAIPQFVDELPLLDSHVAGSAMRLVQGTDLTIKMEEFKANVMPTGFVPATGAYDGTWVWGYQAVGYETNRGGATAETYINPVVLAHRGSPTSIRWENKLPSTWQTETAWATWTDRTLHWADPSNQGHQMTNYVGHVPAVPHLHGGEVPPQLDGGPDAWFLPRKIVPSTWKQYGHAYYSKDWDGVTPQDFAIYNYPNTQEAAPIWFHDHALGITRINVYAGLAGAYLLLDDDNEWPIDEAKIIPIVIQDRMFDTNGQLFFPNVGINPEHPFWVPEFEGDVICVNGKVWPKLTVKPARYAFWFLNGSNARTYDMFLTDPVSKNFGPPIWVIASGGGLLDEPAELDPLTKPINSLVMMPGERYVVIIDFAGYEAGVVGPNGAAYSGTWLLKNTAKTPFPAGVSPQGATTGRVMQFVVNPASTLPDEPFDVAAATTLRGGSGQPPVIETLTATDTRQLTLNEVMGAGGPLAALVNNTKWAGTNREDFTPITNSDDSVTYYSELPMEGTTELWEIVNLTADAHPIHLHLVQFQLQDRQNFNVNKYSGAYAAAFPGGVYIPEYGPPLAYDAGGKLGGNPDVGKLAKNGKPLWLQGPARPPLPKETGWKDTIIAYPGEVTRILVRWAPQDATATGEDYFPFDPNGGHGYVWHCHIIDHEDNEMMRPDSVIENEDATRSFTDY